MYSNKPSFIYGFHGIDKTVAFKILNRKDDFLPSQNVYDWLGSGVYFWENNLERARQYAEEDKRRKDSMIREPFVLGAVIDLGNCLDLLTQDGLDLTRFAYDTLKQNFDAEGLALPENESFYTGDFDFKKRNLDRAVIQFVHELAKKNDKPFDTVRAVFWEGEDLYPGAGFKKHNHIQVAVVNPHCIKGVFLPRLEN